MWVHEYVSTFGTYMTTWLGYPSSYGSTGFISSASRVLILTQYKSPLSTCTILFIRSITPTPSSISSSLKNLISKSLIRGILCPVSIWWPFLFLMPPIRFLASVRRVLLATSISLNSEIMSPCSCCVKKGLLYIIIMAFFGYQPSSCFKANTCFLCDIRSVSTNKYTF